MTKIPGEISCFGRGRGGKPAVEMLWCIAIASNDGMGSGNKPSLFISAERAVLAMINELYKEEPFSHAILSNSRSSKGFKFCFNSLGRVSSCLTKLSTTLLKSKAVMLVLSTTAGNNMVTILCEAYDNLNVQLGTKYGGKGSHKLAKIREGKLEISSK